MEPNQPPFQQPQSDFRHLNFPVESRFKFNAKMGNILLFMSVGFVFVIIGNIVVNVVVGALLVNWAVNFFASILTNIGIAFVIGYLAAWTAIRADMIKELREAGLHGALTAGLTASLFATIVCNCAMMAAVTLEEGFRASGGGLFDYLDNADISAPMLVLGLLGTMLVTVFLSAAFGAIGGMVSGMRLQSKMKHREEMNWLG